MNVPEVFSKSSDIKITYDFANKKYTITGTSEVTAKTIKICLGLPDDKWPCIVLIYHYYHGHSAFEVMGIVSKDYNNGNPTKLKCLDPQLPEKGALDILVMTALGIAKSIDSTAQVFIDDKATIDGTSLSWLKYFEKYETTYSKYGFIIRGEDAKDDAASYPIFENFMKIQLKNVLQMKLKDLYNKTILDKIKESYEKIGQKILTSHTLEKTIKLFLAANKTGYITRYLDKGKYDFINLEGIWELSWYYYDNNISQDKKIHNLIVERI